MWSIAGSALVPGSLTTFPLTVTSPAEINSSACRREAMPAAAISFCRRCSIVLHRDLFPQTQRTPTSRSDSLTISQCLASDLLVGYQTGVSVTYCETGQFLKVRSQLCPRRLDG